MMTRRRFARLVSGAFGPCLVALVALGGVAGRAAELPAPTRAPAAPAEAARRMAVPEGFTVSVFAAEPDVAQPIAFTIDPRGRLWVVENYAYPVWLGGPKGRDRILIFEDRDGDGRFDKRTVFYEGGTDLTGIELGFGGAFVCSTPRLLFIPDRDGDDRPDGPPETVLDGWAAEPRHNQFNGLRWGPDGWLWGLNGILSRSLVGRPGDPESRRVPINCGVWRYHPTRKVFEAVAHGTTNPWGLDFDELGEAFITNCVIPHLFHVVRGGHYQRMFGQDYNPNLYGLLETCADHLHWAGGRWQDSREGKGHDKHSLVGGGHAHVGAMIYLGDNWPAEYRGRVFTCNVHGHRVNQDILRRRNSTNEAIHGPDFLRADDHWFRGLELKYGPDGAVYLTDWSDVGECHETDADNAHRENGRIYKVRHGEARAVSVDLAKEDPEGLARMQLHRNDWYVRTARRLLQERAAAGADLGAAHRLLRPVLASHPDVARRLRALWALRSSGGLTDDELIALLSDKDESVRSWAVRLLADLDPVPARAVGEFARLAREEASPKVRLHLASALQALPPGDRWAVGEGLLSREADAADPMIPLMAWYGVEPLPALDPSRAAGLAAACRIPLVRGYLARRAVSADLRAGLAAFVPPLRGAGDEARRDLLGGILESIRGLRTVDPPASWPAARMALAGSADAAVRERALLLAAAFGEPEAVAGLRELAGDRSAPIDVRLRVLAALVERRVPGLPSSLRALLDEPAPALRGAAIRALASYDDPATPGALLRLYPKLTEAEKDDAIATLSARPAWALPLLDAVASGAVPRRDLGVTAARQLLALGDPKVASKLEAAWGKVRRTADDKTALLARYKALLAADDLPAPDLGRGRAVYDRTCRQCHRLFDSGAEIGPDLTGSDRSNPDYILENVLDPSAAVAREYTLSTIATADGRLVSGFIREQDARALTVQTANERLLIPREDVEEIKPSGQSMMPEGQLERLSPREIRDLFAYLASLRQVDPAP